MKVQKFEEIIPRGLVVSCELPAQHPLDSPEVIASLAKCALMAGAIGIHANGSQRISQVRARNNTPVIGTNVWNFEGFEVCITPTFAAVHDIAIHGPQVIALDGTDRPRPEEDLKTIIEKTHAGFGLPVMAAIDSVENALFAIDQGADCVATTLSGNPADDPDMELLAALVKAVDVPVVAEGRFSKPEHVAEALKIGAHCVVVGAEVTRPEIIAEPYAQAATAALG